MVQKRPGWMRVMSIRVAAVDVGAVGPPPKFAWARFDAPAREPYGSGNDPQTAVSALVAGLAWARQAALLLESPLSVPAPADDDGWRLLGKARTGEGKPAVVSRRWRPGYRPGPERVDAAPARRSGAWAFGHDAA